MKKILFILTISLVFLSCKKWLDVNDNPNSANSTVPKAEQRLPALLPARLLTGHTVQEPTLLFQGSQQYLGGQTKVAGFIQK